MWLAAVVLAPVAAPPVTRAGGFLEEKRSIDEKSPQFVAEPAERMKVEGDDSDAAAAELANAKLRLSEAIQNLEAADHNLTKANRRRYPRGEALEALRKSLADTKKERQAAERDFRATLEQARREGLPAGTLAPYWDYLDWLDQQAAAPASDTSGP